MLEITAISLVVTAILAYLNQRFFGLPTSIGVMAAALLLSAALIGLDALGIAHGLLLYEQSLLRSLDFSNVLMQGMLSLLLFAGALHIDFKELKAYRWQVGTLAVMATVLSTLMVGYVMWLLLPLAGVQLPLIYCLLFGALISPTDPIAVKRRVVDETRADLVTVSLTDAIDQVTTLAITQTDGTPEDGGTA